MLFVPSQGGFPTGFERQVDPAELATIVYDVAQSNPDLVGETVEFGFPRTVHAFWSYGAPLRFHLPFVRTSYFTAADVAWGRRFAEISEPPPLPPPPPPADVALGRRFDENSSDGSTRTEWQAPMTVLEAGTTTRESWNQGVLGPSMRVAGSDQLFFRRAGDEIAIRGPSYYSDRANHLGHSFLESGTARLLRNGELVGDSDSPSFAFFPVPPEASDYRLEVESTRGGDSPLSTQVNLAWTFRSETVPEDGVAPLPLLAVRFTPALDANNAAPAGGFFVIPLSVSRQNGATDAPLSSLRIEASYDRGITWHRALVARFGDEGLALVRHPRQGGGTVSLRARATDEDGNTVEQTILDAYRLRARGGGDDEDGDQ
jgi:hypothetical protein